MYKVSPTDFSYNEDIKSVALDKNRLSIKLDVSEMLAAVEALLRSNGFVIEYS